MGATQKLFRFGVFELNLDAEELRKDGIPIRLPPQPVKVLALLASRAGQMVTRDEIQREIWGEETYVDFEHGLNQCIKQIRTALNDNADKPLYVETIPRRGYRFLAPVVSKTVAIPGPRVTESASGIQSRVSLATASPADETPADVASATMPSPGAAPDSPVQLPVGDSASTSGTAGTAPPDAPVSVHRSGSNVRRSVLAWTALFMLGIIAGGLYWRTHRTAVLTEKDTIILADFGNSAGSPVFDAALKQALTADLEQSPFLNVLPAQKVREQLRYMGLSPDAALNEDVARQVCQRTSSKAMLMGSIASLGSHYLIGLRAENCGTGDVLATEQGEAESQEKVVRVLNKAASTMRAKLGESLASIEKYDTPIEQATTPSLEALQAYSLGLKSQETKGEEAAIPFYKRAIELDPSFAMAYARLGVAYTNLYEETLAAENTTRAYELRERTSEKENLYISAHYYADVTGDLSKAIATYIIYKQIYPRATASYENLSVIYIYTGEYDRCLDEAGEALRLNPDDATIYANYVFCDLSLGRFEHARSMLADAQARKVSHEALTSSYYWLAFLTNDQDGMKRQLAAAMGHPGVEDQILAIQSDTEAYFGHLVGAREYTKRAVDSATRADARGAAAIWQIDGALHDAEVGNISQALREARAALSVTESKGVQAVGALALARSGDPKRAQILADDLRKRYPSDTVVQSYWLPTIQAAIELELNNPDEAIKVLQTATPYEMGAPIPGLGFMYPVYLRGLAFLKAGRGPEATAEFEKILARSGIVQNFPTGALARLQLARALTLKGEKAAARKSYESFLHVWRGADPDIPVLAVAKAAYAGLKSQPN